MSDLYRFVSMGFTHQVKQLLDEGHDPNVPVQVKVGRKIEIQLPIEPACSQSDSEIFIALIKAGAVILPDPQRRNRMLERAAMVGNIPLLNILHSRGLTAELKNAKQGGNAPLVGAITQGKKEAAVWLLDHGADPNGKMKAGKYKVTPLDSVLSSGKCTCTIRRCWRNCLLTVVQRLPFKIFPGSMNWITVANCWPISAKNS